MDDPRPAAIHTLTRKAVPPPRPAKAGKVHLRAGMRPDDAFRLALSDCLTQMTANAGLLRAQRSAEALHQLRVGLRRLEVVLGAFGRSFGQPWLEELRSRAKVLSNRLGPARDLDVFIEELLSGSAKRLGKEGAEILAPLRRAAQAAQIKAWDAVGLLLTGSDFALFIEDVAGLAQSRLPLGPDERLKPMATEMLKRQAARARKRGRAAQSKEEGDLHRLRIALKKLRYTAEIFAPLHGKKQVARYLKRVKRLQEVLGRLNDIAHARTVITQIAPPSREKSDGGLRFAAGMVQGWYAARRPRLVRKALKRWDRLKRSRGFWD